MSNLITNVVILFPLRMLVALGRRQLIVLMLSLSILCSVSVTSGSRIRRLYNSPQIEGNESFQRPQWLSDSQPQQQQTYQSPTLRQRITNFLMPNFNTVNDGSAGQSLSLRQRLRSRQYQQRLRDEEWLRMDYYDNNSRSDNEEVDQRQQQGTGQVQHQTAASLGSTQTVSGTVTRSNHSSTVNQQQPQQNSNTVQTQTVASDSLSTTPTPQISQTQRQTQQRPTAPQQPCSQMTTQTVAKPNFNLINNHDNNNMIINSPLIQRALDSLSEKNLETCSICLSPLADEEGEAVERPFECGFCERGPDLIPNRRRHIINIDDSQPYQSQDVDNHIDSDNLNDSESELTDSISHCDCSNDNFLDEISSLTVNTDHVNDNINKVPIQQNLDSERKGSKGSSSSTTIYNSTATPGSSTNITVLENFESDSELIISRIIDDALSQSDRNPSSQSATQQCRHGFHKYCIQQYLKIDVAKKITAHRRESEEVHGRWYQQPNAFYDLQDLNWQISNHLNNNGPADNRQQYYHNAIVNWTLENSLREAVQEVHRNQQYNYQQGTTTYGSSYGSRFQYQYRIRTPQPDNNDPTVGTDNDNLNSQSPLASRFKTGIVVCPTCKRGHSIAFWKQDALNTLISHIKTAGCVSKMTESHDTRVINEDLKRLKKKGVDLYRVKVRMSLTKSKIEQQQYKRNVVYGSANSKGNLIKQHVKEQNHNGIRNTGDTNLKSSKDSKYHSENHDGDNTYFSPLFAAAVLQNSPKILMNILITVAHSLRARYPVFECIMKYKIEEYKSGSSYSGNQDRRRSLRGRGISMKFV